MSCQKVTQLLLFNRKMFITGLLSVVSYLAIGLVWFGLVWFGFRGERTEQATLASSVRTDLNCAALGHQVLTLYIQNVLGLILYLCQCQPAGHVSQSLRILEDTPVELAAHLSLSIRAWVLHHNSNLILLAYCKNNFSNEKLLDSHP